MRKRAVRGSQLQGEIDSLARKIVENGGHYTKEYRVERGITYVHYKITTAQQLNSQSNTTVEQLPSIIEQLPPLEEK